MERFAFEKMVAWQKARELVKEVYILIGKFPRSEKYCLESQLSRAILSVPSNLAEGSGRRSPKERGHFYEIAFGSLMESFNQLILAQDLKYITEEELENLRIPFREVAKMISGLRNSCY